MKLKYEEIHGILSSILLDNGFKAQKADVIARIFTDNTLAGVNSHGVNRFASFIDYIKKGLIRIHAEAECIESFGCIERWDGELGPGMVNAIACTNRACELAKNHGMGLVALRNTNHWMRGGTYARQAADAGCIAILFTNTLPNVPPWGGRDSRIGNNPFVIGIPRSKGHIVLDMAMSQFSYGKINEYKLRGDQLPYPGGWDHEDQLTTNPEEILKQERGLPIGYWKGSALSMVLDILATVLSAGNSTYRIGLEDHETAVSQVFICIDPNKFKDRGLQEKLVEEIIEYTRQAEPLSVGSEIYFPGEQSNTRTDQNKKAGIPVDDQVWSEIISLTKE